MRYRKCTKCGNRHTTAPGSDYCRKCRGWHICPKCKKRKANSEFYQYYRSKEGKWRSSCRACEKAARKPTASGPSARRSTKPNYDCQEKVYRFYNIPDTMRPMVSEALEAYNAQQPATLCLAKKPKGRSALNVLECAGPEWTMTLMQAVIELYRLETAKREAA